MEVSHIKSRCCITATRLVLASRTRSSIKISCQTTPGSILPQCIISLTYRRYITDMSTIETSCVSVGWVHGLRYNSNTTSKGSRHTLMITEFGKRNAARPTCSGRRYTTGCSWPPLCVPCLFFFPDNFPWPRAPKSIMISLAIRCSAVQFTLSASWNTLLRISSTAWTERCNGSGNGRLLRLLSNILGEEILACRPRIYPTVDMIVSWEIPVRKRGEVVLCVSFAVSLQ